MSGMQSVQFPEYPEETLAAVVALRSMADRLERKTIKTAIEQGRTWARIAEALGVSKRAAHKCHADFIKLKNSEKGGL